jgi:hypothetical protein
MNAAATIQMFALAGELVRPEGLCVNPNIGADTAAIRELARTLIAAGNTIEEVVALVDEVRGCVQCGFN